MRVYVHLDRDECERKLPAMLIAETTSRAIWDTGRRKRRWKEEFTDSERDALYDIIAQARRIALRYGWPEDGITTTVNRLVLWRRLGDFCASL